MKTARFLTLLVLLAAGLAACHRAPRYANRAERLLAELADPTSDYAFVMAHRGDWRNWPENSLEAIESAIAMGCDILELDVAMTRDSQLVLCHDATLDRTTDGHGRIADHTLAEIKELRLRHGHRFHCRRTGHEGAHLRPRDALFHARRRAEDGCPAG